jgi:prepilin-type N-terminal cleavage/methylation domain-containing protein
LWFYQLVMRNPANKGLSLIELMLVIALLAILAVIAAPFALGWSYGASTLDAKGKLVFGYSKAKAVALRNPTNALHGVASAGLAVLTDGMTTTVLVCSGSSSACTPTSGSLQWSATYPGAITTTVGGTTVASAVTAHLDIDSRGIPLSATTFTLSRGGGNDETGTLY